MFIVQLIKMCSTTNLRFLFVKLKSKCTNDRFLNIEDSQIKKHLLSTDTEEIQQVQN